MLAAQCAVGAPRTVPQRTSRARTPCKCMAAARQGQAHVQWAAAAVVTGSLAVSLLAAFPAEAAGVRVKGFPSNAGDELSEKYQQGAGKKAQQSARRKAGLAQTRADALAAGGTTDTATAKSP